MENMQYETRPCANCGGSIGPDDTTCATCGQPYIPTTDEQPPPPTIDVDPVPGQAGRTDDPTASGDASFGHAGTPPPPSFGSTPPRDLMGPVEVSDESRMWAMGAHLGALLGIFLGGLPAFLAPLLVWLLRRDQNDPFATDHAREALNFNLSIIIYGIAAAVLSIVTLGLGLLIVVPVALVAFIGYVIVTVLATAAASRSERYRYPLTIRMVR